MSNALVIQVPGRAKALHALRGAESAAVSAEFRQFSQYQTYSQCQLPSNDNANSGFGRR